MENYIAIKNGWTTATYNNMDDSHTHAVRFHLHKVQKQAKKPNYGEVRIMFIMGMGGKGIVWEMEMRGSHQVLEIRYILIWVVVT